MRLDSTEMFSAAAMLRQHASSLATLRAASDDYQRAIVQAGFSGNALGKALDNTREASKGLGAPAQRMNSAAQLLEAFATLQQRAEKLMLCSLGESVMTNLNALGDARDWACARR